MKTILRRARSFLSRLRRAGEALRHDPAPWSRPATHRLPRHGALFIDFATGERWKYDARRGKWRSQPLDVPATGRHPSPYPLPQGEGAQRTRATARIGIVGAPPRSVAADRDTDQATGYSDV